MSFYPSQPQPLHQIKIHNKSPIFMDHFGHHRTIQLSIGIQQTTQCSVALNKHYKLCVLLYPVLLVLMGLCRMVFPHGFSLMQLQWGGRWDWNPLNSRFSWPTTMASLLTFSASAYWCSIGNFSITTRHFSPGMPSSCGYLAFFTRIPG